MKVVPPLVINYDIYSKLLDADISCDIVPDNWAFVDDKLTRWNNFVDNLYEGKPSFKRIKVGLRRYADLTGIISDYEQSNTEGATEEESDLWTEKHIKF